MTLDKKFKEIAKKGRKALALGVFGGSLVLNGCGQIRTYDNRKDLRDDNAALGFGLIGLGVGKNNSGAIVAGRALMDYSGRSQSGTDINIEVGVGGGQAPKAYESPMGKFFACNHFEDLNGNGYTDYPGDFIGIKNRFFKGEKLALFGFMWVLEGDSVRLDLWDGNKGKMINRYTKLEDVGIPNIIIESRDLEVGSYKGVFYKNGKNVGNVPFDIVY